jgi:hypothetical protein
MKGPSKPYDLFSSERAEARKKMASDISAGKVKPENETAQQLAEKLRQEFPKDEAMTTDELNALLAERDDTAKISAVHMLEDSVSSTFSTILPSKS